MTWTERTAAADPSRARTDALLADLRAGGWRPRAWAVFVGRAARMSASAVAARPRAAAEVSALHLALAAASRRRGRIWIGGSWLLAITHLGLLEEQRSLGTANAATLIRANLPMLGIGRPAAVIAVTTDLLDGRLARRRGQVTVFGAYAGSLADAVFWTWFATRHERNCGLRAAAPAVWAVPAAAVALVGFARGGMVDPPRPRLLRPAVALQIVLTVRALCGTGSPRPVRHDPADRDRNLGVQPAQCL